MSENVVPIRGGKMKDDGTSAQAALDDIPGMLRLLAAQVESGETIATSMLVIIPVPGQLPELRGWGDVEGRNEPAIQLDLAKQFILSTLVD
jgi:hypothetical protein